MKPNLEAIKKRIKNKQETVEALNNESLNSCDADLVEKEIFDRSEFEAEVEETICLLENALVIKSLQQ